MSQERPCSPGRGNRSKSWWQGRAGRGTETSGPFLTLGSTDFPLSDRAFRTDFGIEGGREGQREASWVLEMKGDTEGTE